MNLPILALTMGDPAGIGAEVIVKALNHPSSSTRSVVIGSLERLQKAAKLVGSRLPIRSIERPDELKEKEPAIFCIDTGVNTTDIAFGSIDPVAGEAAYSYVERAAALALEGEVAAIVTGPLSKEALHAAGHRYPGHTELLAHFAAVPEVSMMLTAPGLRVVHVTTHIGLLDAIDRIDDALVERTILRGHEALTRSGIAAPRIGVCGINPHAGESGLFGRGEEATKIVPAVQRCREASLSVEGPLPADTLFFRARRGDFDLVVAMYHDQGHGPVKVLGLESGVNITIGLPFVRTSVDHGTAFDIAGTGAADESSFLEAMRQALQMVRHNGVELR